MTINQYVQSALAVVGAIYTILSVVGNVVPNTKVGRFCAKAALVLRKVEGK